MFFQSIEGGEHFPYHGEPSPREIHALYEIGQRVVRESYPGELKDMYIANGRYQVQLLSRVGGSASAFILRHESLMLRGVVAGPAIKYGQLESNFMSLWVPREMKFV